MQEHIVVAKILLVHPHEPKLLLLRRSSTDPRRPGQWDIPGGKFEPYQDRLPFNAAIRECQEEAGIVIGPDDLNFLTADHEEFHDADPKVVDWLFYFAKSGTDRVELSYEHDDFRWVEPSEALSGMLSYARHIKIFEFALKSGALKRYKISA